MTDDRDEKRVQVRKSEPRSSGAVAHAPDDRWSVPRQSRTIFGIATRGDRSRSRPGVAVCSALPVVCFLCCSIPPTSDAAEISQYVDQPPKLLVFVHGVPNEAVPARYYDRRRVDPLIAANLNGLPLPVKPSDAWNRDSGMGIVLLLDDLVARSLDEFHAVKRQLLGVLAGLPANTRVTVLLARDRLVPPQPFTSAATAAQSLIDWKQSAAPANLYGAIVAAEEFVRPARDILPLRRIMVVVAASEDADPGAADAAVLSRIASSFVPVYLLMVGSTPPDSAQRERIRRWSELARASGGAFLLTSSDKVDAGMRSLLNDALGASILEVDCSACPRDGVERDFQIEIRMNGGTSTDARSLRLGP